MNMIRKAIKDPNKALKHLTYRVVKGFLAIESFKPFIVLTRSRTGSNMLISFLNSHPNIWARSEIFKMLNGKNYKNILDKIFSKQPYYIKATGFKIFYCHPLDDNSCDIWNDLASMQGLYVIHLKRRNILRTLISRKIAGIQGVWATPDRNTPNRGNEKGVEFTIDELEKGFEQTRRWEDEGGRIFSDHQVLNIYYEDLVRSPESEFKKITDLLDLGYSRPQTDIRKQNPEKISELIINYEELKAAFEGGEWEVFFED